MLLAINHLQNMETIDVKYMESGHFQREADSVHATIERSRKPKKIYITHEWTLLFPTTRIKTSPYEVTNIHYNEVYDLEKLVKDMVKNSTINTENDKINWLKIKRIRFQKTEPYI